MNLRWIAALAAVLAAVAVATAATRTGPAPRHPPVVLVVFDALPVNMLEGPAGTIDAARFPNFAALAGDGIWFRNATTVHDSTVKAVPAIFDGRWPDNHRRPDFEDHPDNIFTALHPVYEVHATEPATSLCPTVICGPPKNRRLLYVLHADRERNFERAVAGIHRRKKPVLHAMHVLFPHEPLRYLPDGTVYEGGKDPEPGLDGNESFDNAFLTAQADQRHLLQLQFTDRLLGKMLARLRSQKMYDDALVIVTADHGISFQVKSSPSPRYQLGKLGWRRDLTRANAGEVATPALFVKLPDNRRAGTTDSSWVRSVDIAPTIADVAHVKLGYRSAGRSLLHPRSSGATLDFTTNQLGDVKIPRETIERGRAAAIERSAKRFANGIWNVGPSPAMVGRSVKDLRVLRPGRLRARLWGPRRFAAVDRRRGRLPLNVIGWLEGGPAPGRRLAVAVNGRIAATSVSFHAMGSTAMNMSTLIPPESLRNGSNRIRIYEIRDSETLRPIPLS